jgi:hypothetical protein
MKKYTLALLVTLAASAVTVLAQDGSPTLYQKPTLNRTHIVFVYAQ